MTHHQENACLFQQKVTSTFISLSVYLNKTLGFSIADLRSVIFALVVDRKELDHVDELKRLMIQSLKPEPQAVKSIKMATQANTEQEHTKRNKKSKVRVVDLDCDEVVEQPATAFNSHSVAITIPQISSTPSLMLQHAGSSPSVKSIDSQDDRFGESKRPAMNLSEMKQMLLDLTDKKCQLEESKSSLQLQLHGVQLEKQDLQDRFKVMEQQNTELLR